MIDRRIYRERRKKFRREIVRWIYTGKLHKVKP